MISIKKINEVEVEIKRFRRAVDGLRMAMVRKGTKYEEYCPAETGAVRRASMDLTRALTRLRRVEVK